MTLPADMVERLRERTSRVKYEGALGYYSPNDAALDTEAATLITTLSEELEAVKEARDVAMKRIEEWRQDAAARLETYIGLMNSNLIGTDTQVRVTLIMPTYAMLHGDTIGEFYEPTDDNGEPLEPYVSDIDDVLKRTRAIISYDDDAAPSPQGETG